MFDLPQPNCVAGFSGECGEQRLRLERKVEVERQLLITQIEQVKGRTADHTAGCDSSDAPIE